MSNSIQSFFKDVNLLFGTNSTTKQILVSGPDAISVQIIHILSTARGSYEFEPTFGSDLPNLLWEPVDAQTGWLMRTSVYEALLTWLPVIRLDLTNTEFVPNEEDYSYDGRIAYTINTTGEYKVLSLALPGNK